MIGKRGRVIKMMREEHKPKPKNYPFTPPAGKFSAGYKRNMDSDGGDRGRTAKKGSAGPSRSRSRKSATPLKVPMNQSAKHNASKSKK